MPIDPTFWPAAGWTDECDDRICIRPLQAALDCPVLHGWFNLPHAGFWGMQGQTEGEMRAFYEALLHSGHAMAGMGLFDGARAFIVECYDPAFDPLAAHYPVRAGDLGMHFFVGPPETPMRGFTRRVFRSILRFMFGHLGAQRIVVEPDVRNHKVQVLNREMGFAPAKEIQLPHKRAGLAFCTLADFNLSLQKESTE